MGKALGGGRQQAQHEHKVCPAGKAANSSWVCVNRSTAQRARKPRIVPLPVALTTPDRALSLGPCNAGNTWENGRDL